MNDHSDTPHDSQAGRKKKSGGFQSLGLSEPVYRGIVKMGFRVPTPVQRKSLPVILSGVDTVVMARTGSGKTAAFLIPLLERVLATRGSASSSIIAGNTSHGSAVGVILSPTRELSLQTLKVLRTLSSYCTNIKSIGINGGESMEKQFALLSNQHDIICATPGRLAHHLNEITDFTLNRCIFLVFDEADRLFEMGFALQIRSICASMPTADSGRQTLLFSATMPKVLVEFTKSGIMGDPQVVRLDSEATVSEELRIGFVTVRSAEKDAALLYLLRQVLPQSYKSPSDGRKDHANTPKNSTDQKLHLGLTLIFAATRHHVDYITTLINSAGLSSQATSIYGTMDQEARKLNLSLFRSGKYPILVVTDVAARGIDIPLIDHVIHYSFPPSAKLFVHRSGRAARAGRAGYCWGLVDTEELPYMVDLYLFLGRKLSCGRVTTGSSREEDGPSEKESEYFVEDQYTLNEMTPDMVHFGSVPELVVTEEIENVRRIINSELTGSHDAQTLRSLLKVCENAMKQYRRTRPEASNEGKRRARDILEGKKELTGKRIGKGRIPCHPVFREVELKRILLFGENAIDQLKQREAFLQSLSNFRPRETVFEAFATGGGKEVGVLSHIDKGRTTHSTKKNDSSLALAAMKGMRRQMKIATDKSSTLIVAGSQDVTSAQSLEAISNHIEHIDEDHNESNQVQDSCTEGDEPKTLEKRSKRRISKAARRKIKKTENDDGIKRHASYSISFQNEKTKFKRGADFRDAEYYIDHDSTKDGIANLRSREIEKAMQPSSSNSKDPFSSALRLEEAILDMVGDENAELVQKHRMNRWDKSKRKYVQTTLGTELSRDSKSKRVRLESGLHLNKDKMKMGELYEKWVRKNSKTASRAGFIDEANADAREEDLRTDRVKNLQGQKVKNTVDSQKKAIDIKKQREAEKKMRIKNMKRSDRRRLESKVRTDRNKTIVDKQSMKKNRHSRNGR